MIQPALTRRRLLTGAAAIAAAGVAQRGAAAGFAEVRLAGGGDQTPVLQAAIDTAAADGKDLLLPTGTFEVTGLRLPGNLRIIGTPGGTWLTNATGQPAASASEITGLIIDGVGFGPAGAADVPALSLENTEHIVMRNCAFTGAHIGIGAYRTTASIEDCVFTDLADAAIHSVDSSGGMMVRGNRISRCGNAGIRIWRETQGHDGSIVTGNAIDSIDWRGGGNGQNGNAINIFRADGVIVADNVTKDCAFTGVRVNAGRNTQIRGNTCLNSGEVGIFSEFAFSGSVVANNIVDGAATGIDITNLDTGGYLATCSGNIVRNIFPRSEVNPDTRPVGIYAEADTVVSGNVIEMVPGVGIVAGFGPFVRNVSISGNVLTGCDVGIGVTVVDDPAVGAVRVSGNLVAAPRLHGLAGFEWERVVSDDLARDAARYRHLTVSDNTVS